MSTGKLNIHVVNAYGIPLSNANVVAKKGSTTKSCTADAGMCFLLLPYGTWMVVARSNDGCSISGMTEVEVNSPSVVKTIQVSNPATCYETNRPANCPPCPPCSAAGKGIGPGASYGSSTKESQDSRIRVGGINMSDCRWIPTTSTPSGSLNADGTINWAAFSSGDDAVALVGQENIDKVAEAVVLDVINQGEDPGDAQAIAGAVKIHILLDNANGKYYALADATATSGYAGLFVQKCGVALNLPWMLGGAVILGGIGLAIGSRYGKGRKGAVSKRNALLGGLAGVAAGAGAGFLVAKLATPSYMKSAGLGRVPRNASRRRRVA